MKSSSKIPQMANIIKKFLLFITVFRRYSKIAWHKKSRCDVLIYDAEGSDIILQCIPIGIPTVVLRVREGIPLIKSGLFFALILIGIIKYKNLNQARHYALIKIMMPKIIITYIDNCPFPYVIKEIFPDIQIMAVQNGTRWDFSRPDSAIFNFDHYFCFGLVEADIMSRSGNNVKHLYPIGSVRLGIFKDINPQNNELYCDICHISQYAPLPYEIEPQWMYKCLMAYYETEKKLFNIIAEFAAKNKLSLCVAMRYSSEFDCFEEECKYFACNANRNIRYIEQAPFSSYNAGQTSRLITTISSTLGYEMLGLGKRVIFAKDIALVKNIVMLGSWEKPLITHKLPDLQRLHHLDYSEFNVKATALLEMTDEVYVNYSEKARDYYMNYNNQQNPNEIIKSKINQYLLPSNEY